MSTLTVIYSHTTVMSECLMFKLVVFKTNWPSLFPQTYNLGTVIVRLVFRQSARCGYSMLTLSLLVANLVNMK